MLKKERREESLSRDRIVEASIEMLDQSGESALTFRALAEKLATGPGAIYWHVASKSELLTSACDSIVADALSESPTGATPEATIRALALSMFNTMDAHPWIGSALTLAPGQLPVVRILERLGQAIRALGVPEHSQWIVVSALLSYILGVGGQNAANTQLAHKQGWNRTDLLESMSTMWSQLGPTEYPFARSLAEKLRSHDDRTDFLAGVDLILVGIQAQVGQCSREGR